MSVRSLKFNISAASQPQKNQRVWGGMQYEDNATEFCFKPDDELLNVVGATPLFRIDFNGISGYDPSENLSADSDGYFSRLLPYSMTRYGGEVEVVFVITSNDVEILSFPITVYLTHVQRDAVSSDEVHTHISEMEASVKQMYEATENNALKVETATDSVEAMHEELKKVYFSADELVEVKESAEAVVSDIETKLSNGEFKGEKGDKGDQGIQGIQGIQGEKGDQGIQGEKGDKGDKGDAGEVSLSYANNTLANALKGTASGSAFLLSDVSPIEHAVEVKVNSEESVDLSTVKVKTYGKNLLDMNILRTRSNWKGDVSHFGWSSGIWYMRIPVDPNQTYIFRRSDADWTPSYDGATYRFSDLTEDELTYYNAWTNATNTIWSTGKKSQPYKYTSGYITITTYQAYRDDPSLLPDIQLELGSTATDYEPYIEPTEYAVNADGTVEGVTSIYPNMTLTTDTNGVLIDCEYNRDINKAFEELYEAFSTLSSAAVTIPLTAEEDTV